MVKTKPVGSPEALIALDEAHRVLGEVAFKYRRQIGPFATQAVGVVHALTRARSDIAELIEADVEYDAANRDWERATSNDPEELSDETWRRIADRFEAAVMRRIAALARVQGGAG